MLLCFSRNTRPETRPFPWLAWYRLVLKPFSLVFSAGMCSGLRVMTPLLGTKTPSAPVGDAPAGDDKAAQATAFQVFTGPETRDKAIAWREAQAGANSEVFTNHETRDPKHGFFQTRNTAFPWLVWYRLVLKPFSLFFGRELVYVESDDAVVGNENPIRARREQVGWGRKSRPVATFLRVVARHGAAMARHGRPPSPAPATGAFGFSRITRHESRNMAFPRPCGDSKESNPKPEQRVFHETRNTRHQSRLLCFPTHDFPLFPTISRQKNCP